MIYIAIKDNKIIHVCETNAEKNVIKSMAYEGIQEYDLIKPINNDYFPGKVGNDIREFDFNYEFLPLSERKDYITIPEGMKIEGEGFVPMTVKDKIDDGIIKLTDREKYNEETKEVCLKTIDELLTDNVITAAEWYDTKLKECLSIRKYAYMSESDPLKNELEFDGEDLQAWKDKVIEIKARYPKPVMP